MKIVISSGHGSKVEGAVGPSPWGLHEHAEAVRVVNQTAIELRKLGVDVTTYEDTVSTNQDDNLERIVSFHNSKVRDLDISVHFNSATFDGSNQTNNPVGCEVFYESSAGKEVAKKVVDAICTASGLKNRGAKDGNLYFLSNTSAVAALLEICFVNSRADVDIYTNAAKFSAICSAIAGALAGEDAQPGPTPPDPGTEGVLFAARGTVSWFGGPDDSGVASDEGLAMWYKPEECPWLMLPKQPSNTTGMARRLDPSVFYFAARFDYSVTPKEMLRGPQMGMITATKTGISRLAHVADWGPHEEQTGRACDISPGLMENLGIDTDSEVTVTYPAP